MKRMTRIVCCAAMAGAAALTAVAQSSGDKTFLAFALQAGPEP